MDVYWLMLKTNRPVLEDLKNFKIPFISSTLLKGEVGCRVILYLLLEYFLINCLELRIHLLHHLQDVRLIKGTSAPAIFAIFAISISSVETIKRSKQFAFLRSLLSSKLKVCHKNYEYFFLGYL